MTLDENGELWMGQADAALELGIHTSTLKAWYRAGRIERKKKGGLFVYDVAHVLEADEAEPKVVDASDEEERPERASPAPAFVGAQQMAATTGLLKQSQTHVEALVRMVSGPATHLLEALQKENTSLRDECQRLRESHAAMIETREELLSQANQRRIEEEMAQASMRQRQAITSAAVKQIPGILTALQAKFLGNSEEMAGILGAVGAIKTEKLELLMETDLLDADEKAAMQKVLDLKKRMATTEEPPGAPPANGMVS